MTTTMQPEELAEIIRENILRRRGEKDLSQAALAEMVGVTPSCIAQIETGVAVPSMANLARIANALSTTPAAMLSEGIFSVSGVDVR